MSSNENIKEKVIKIIADQLDREPSEIDLDASLIDDLGADSLATVELVLELEEVFEISIPDEEAEKIKTVRQAVEKIEAEVNKS
jgi:acyl carrier protein